MPAEKRAGPEGRAEWPWATVSQATARVPKVLLQPVLNLEKFQVEKCLLGHEALGVAQTPADPTQFCSCRSHLAAKSSSPGYPLFANNVAPRMFCPPQMQFILEGQRFATFEVVTEPAS